MVKSFVDIFMATIHLCIFHFFTATEYAAFGRIAASNNHNNNDDDDKTIILIWCNYTAHNDASSATLAIVVNIVLFFFSFILNIHVLRLCLLIITMVR